MTGRTNGRKWTGFKWRVGIEVIVILSAVGLAFMSKEAAIPMLIAGLADLTANYASYYTANVTQKNIVSKNFQPDLVDK